MANAKSSIRDLVAEELRSAVDPRVSAVAAAIAAKHGAASRAVLFYGSCLRDRTLKGRMLDFYLIVSGYAAAYDKRWLAAANRLIPPNVFHFEHGGLVSKYAVLSEADFAHECSSDAWTVSTAARFAQPSRLAWSADEAAAERVTGIVSDAAPTLLGWTLPLADRSNVPGAVDPGVRAHLRGGASRRAAWALGRDRRGGPGRYRALRRGGARPRAHRDAGARGRPGRGGGASSGTASSIRSLGWQRRA